MSFRLVLTIVLTVVAGLGRAAPVRADEVQVAVAANFASTLAQLAPAFHKATGHVLRASPGATGKLYAQIVQGAPFQVLLAADAVTAERLQASGHAVAGTRQVYAIGRLVLYSARPGVVDPKAEILRSGTFRKLALANARLAPYGLAAEAVLGQLGLLDALRPRFVVGENIAQTFQFVQSGNAELGFVALSQVVDRPGGSRWVVPQSLHSPLRQEAVLLAKGRDRPAAKAFLAWLRGPEATAVLRASGYEVPASP